MYVRISYPKPPISLNIANGSAKMPVHGTACYVFLRKMSPKIGGHMRGQHPPKIIFSPLKAVPYLQYGLKVPKSMVIYVFSVTMTKMS